MTKQSKNKRSRMLRYSPTNATALRDEIVKHPNPMFGQMLAQGRMTDGDLCDFAFHVAKAYFSGDLLEPVATAAGHELERMTRRTLLVTAALFGMTATFEKDGGAVLKSAWVDADTQTAAVQALVDTGLSVKDAMASFKTGPPEPRPSTEPIHTRLPEPVVDVVN